MRLIVLVNGRKSDPKWVKELKNRSKRLLQKDDELLFETFYRKYSRLMLVAAYNILNNHTLAEDAVSEAFIRIAKCWNNIKRLKAEQMERYAYISAKNSAINILKKEKKHFDHAEYNDDMIADERLNDIPDDHIIEQIKKLSVTDKEILYLRFSMGLDHKSISTALSISPAAARKRLQYARQNLSALLRKSSEEHEGS